MSGRAVYNMFVRGTNYNWTHDAIHDFDQIVTFLQKYLPLGDVILSNETVANARENLLTSLQGKFENSLDKSLPVALESGTKIKNIHLFPPGTCIHMYRDGVSFQGNFVPCNSFDDIEIVNRMIDDHLLDTGYYAALSTFIRNLKKDYNWNFEYDIIDFEWIREAYQNR